MARVLAVLLAVVFGVLAFAMWRVLSLERQLQSVRYQVNQLSAEHRSTGTRIGELEGRVGQAESDISSVETSKVSLLDVRREITRRDILVSATSIRVPLFCSGQVAYWEFFQGLSC